MIKRKAHKDWGEELYQKSKKSISKSIKVVLMAVIGVLLSISLLFLTVWARNSQAIANDFYSDHTTSLRHRLQEVLFGDNQVWEKIINSQLSINDTESTSSIITAGYVLTGIDLNKPATFLASQIPGLEVAMDNQVAMDIPDDTIAESVGPIGVDGAAVNGAGYELTLPSNWQKNSNEPVLFIYHTHNTEAYMPDSGSRYNENGTKNTVVEIGDYLSETISSKYDIPVAHSQKNHIWEPFWAAYTHSLQTIETALSTMDSINYVIDIHNDGVGEELTTMTMEGQTYARLYLVVGADRTRNPMWEKNRQFALRLQEKLEQRYPGLSRGILLQETARYNQHLKANSLLIEVGGYKNTVAEAKRSTAILAELLSEIIMEDIASGVY